MDDGDNDDDERGPSYWYRMAIDDFDRCQRIDATAAPDEIQKVIEDLRQGLLSESAE